MFPGDRRLLTSHIASTRPSRPLGGYRGAADSPRIARIVRRDTFYEVRLLTVSEVADLLRVSRMTVYRLIKTGELPSLRVGKSYRLREPDIHTYLNDRYTEAG